jgi:hypothetical protein
MNYIVNILWLLTWPLLIYASYRAVWYMINRYEKKGLFRTEYKEEDIRE